MLCRSWWVGNTPTKQVCWSHKVNKNYSCPLDNCTCIYSWISIKGHLHNWPLLYKFPNGWSVSSLFDSHVFRMAMATNITYCVWFLQIKLWQIPEEGMKEPVSSPLCVLPQQPVSKFKRGSVNEWREWWTWSVLEGLKV